MSKDIEIIGEGISALNCDLVSECETRLSYIDELARALYEEAGEEEIFFRDDVFREKYFSCLPSGGPKCADFNARPISVLKGGLSVFDRAQLCIRLCDLLGIQGLMSVSTFFDETEEGDGSICYVKSPSSDRAYLKLAEEVNDARVVYAEDFSKACENVYYGKCTYCILPVSSSTDGRLMGFKNLAKKFSLFTACAVSVKSEDSETTFALMKRELEIPSDPEGVLFETRIPDVKDVGEILYAARVCGMEALAVSLSPHAEGECELLLKVSDDGICGFLTYLSLEHRDFIPVGIYKLI